MAVVLVVAGRECRECEAITFVSDLYSTHHGECHERSRAVATPVEMFVLPVAILSSAEPRTNQVDFVKFTIRFDWKGYSFWREFSWR
jgi:hypothetical protein